MFLVCVVILDLHLFQEIILLNFCFMFFLSFINKVKTGTQSLVLFIYFFSCKALWKMCNDSAGGLAGTIALFNISEITHSSYHDKSSSVLQLIKRKSGDLQKLLKHFNGTTTFVFNIRLLLASFFVIFVLYSRDSLVVVLLLLTRRLATVWLAESFFSSV